MTCVKCGKPLPERSGPGRPQVFCGKACRRVAEYELRRLQKALQGVEESLRHHRESLALSDGYGFTCCGRKKAEHVVIIDVERGGLEDRLRCLLDGDDENAASGDSACTSGAHA